jgi:hypothetical protein
VDPPAVARGAEFADRPAFTVRPADREDVAEEFDPAVLGAERNPGRGDDRPSPRKTDGDEQPAGRESTQPRQFSGAR